LVVTDKPEPMLALQQPKVETPARKPSEKKKVKKEKKEKKKKKRRVDKCLKQVNQSYDKCK